MLVGIKKSVLEVNIAYSKLILIEIKECPHANILDTKCHLNPLNWLLYCLDFRIFLDSFKPNTLNTWLLEIPFAIRTNQ